MSLKPAFTEDTTCGTTEKIELFDNRRSVLTTRQLAEVLNVSVATIHCYRKGRRIPFFRIGRQYRYFLTEVLAALKKKASSITWSDQHETSHGSNRKDKLWLV